MNKEIRHIVAENLRVSTSSGGRKTLQGYAAIFNKLSGDLGGFVERIAPGAFASALEKSDVRALYNHDANFILGRQSAGTLRLNEDDTGLYMEVDLPDTQFARDLETSVERGDITQQSFGFTVKRDNWGNNPEGLSIRTLEEIEELFDVSPVVFPAYPDTTVALRSLNAHQKNIKGTKNMRQNMTIAANAKEAFLETVTPRARDEIRGIIDERLGSTTPPPRHDLPSVEEQRNGGWPSENDSKIFTKFLRSGDTSRMELRAMSAGTGSSGGYLVPEQLDNQLNNYLQDANAMRQIASLKQVHTSNYTKVFNRGGLGAAWVGETAARPDTGTPTLEEITPPTGELYCNAPITQWLLDDAGFDIEGWLMGEIENKFVSLEGDAFINGDGTNKPLGLLQYPTATTGDDVRAFGTLKSSTVVADDAITMDELLDLTLDLRSVYRNGAVWLMNSSTAGFVRKLKDSTGQYLWQNNLQAGVPPLLNGYPVYIDESMPDIAASAVPVAFGNFKLGYEIVDRTPLGILRDPYTNKPYVNFYCAKRVSGMVVDSNAIRLLQMASS